MSVFRALVRRELSAFFQGPTGFIIIAAVLFLIGLGFVIVLSGLNGQATPMPVTQVFYSTYFFWLILLLIAPIITMRSFAMERASGTYESLMTAPVGDWQVVLAKFAGALIFYMILWTPLLVCSLVVRFYVGESAVLGLGPMATSALGILLVGCLYMSMGCFASALTRNQAAVLHRLFFVLRRRPLGLDFATRPARVADQSHGIVFARRDRPRRSDLFPEPHGTVPLPHAQSSRKPTVEITDE